MRRETLAPDALARPAGHFSHGVIVECARTLYVAGQTPVNENGELVCPGDAEGQARQCYRNVQKVVKAAGGSMKDVVKIQVFVTSLDDRSAVGRARAEFFPDNPPASTFLVVSSLADPHFLVEVEAVVPLPPLAKQRR